METAAALALGSAATATAPATVGLLGSAGAFSFMQTASTVGTLFSLGSTIAGGMAASGQAKADAKWNDLRARQEELRGKQEATQIKDSLAASIATANARGAASGIDISSGSPQAAVQEAIRDANNAWSVAELNADMGASVARQNAQTNRAQARNYIRTSRVQASGIASDYMNKQYDRGFRF
jgi:hypothetical protein